MARPVLHFSHANGFPAPCYAAMTGELAHDYRVEAIEAIGTDPRYPPTEGWTLLVEQLIDTLERAYRGEPVYGAGHSLGGYLTFLAAVKRPELFRAVVLLDAPIIGPVKGRLLGASKTIGIVDRVTPAGATRDRLAEWDSREQARAHFRTRTLFRRFTEQCLDDYVQHALVEKRGRFRLKIDPAIEYLIYRTVPHDMHRHLRELKVPAGIVGGTESDVVRRVSMSHMRGPRFLKRRVPGGHLFPFENPRAAAAAVEELLDALAPA